VSDFKLKVIAETQTAERSLKQVGEVADKATKARSLDIKVPSLSGVTKTFQTLERDVKNAANTINTFYKVGKALPGNFGESVRAIENIGKGAAKSAIALNNNNTAAEIFSNTLKGATGAAGQLVTTLAKVGFATFAIKETVGLLQAAFTGFFNNTIGREVKLRETILKTQTTLASTNKVFKDGKEITDPYQKIVTLTGAVNKNIESIRERSIALAGVTSGEVIEVFGIVASQIGQIGGGLKEAEDLAIQFAAALGTFGLPIYQARQEIGSILRGDIGIDSILAKSLQISSKDIAEAKTKVGGVVKFLEERLAAAVAGQRIAAEGFSGVVSNIKDLGELIGQNFGTGMLQPLLHSLTAVFETLFRIRKQIFDIAAKAGETVGRVGTLVVGLTAGRTGAGKGVDASAAASAASDVAKKAFTEIQSVAQRTVGAIAVVIASLKPTALILADAFSNVAEAFVQIKVGSFEALASALANVARAASLIVPIFAGIFNLYARFLNTPIVQYFAEVATVLALLKRAGLDAATSLLLFGKFVVSSVIPALGVFGTAAGAVVAGIAAIGLAIGKLVLVLAGLASALVTPAAAIPAVAAAFQALSASLTNVGNQAVGANTKLAGLSKGLTALGATAKAAGGAILASLGWVVAFQVGIAVVVDALGRYQRAQEDKKSSARAAEALRRLQTTYKDVGDSADSATKAARDFEQAIVSARYDNIVNEVEKINEKIKEIDEYLNDDSLLGQILKSPGRKVIIEAQVKRQEQINTLKKEAAEIDAQRDRKLGEENVKLIANKQIDLNKEIAELERQQQNDLFQQRQTLAQKEVDIFRAAGELRIFHMEQANAKLIEGEEGASRTALEALNNYLSVRENGELEIEAAKKDIAIEVANLEKTIADYRFENEKKIAEIKKRSAENEKAMADAQRQAAGQAPAGAGGGGAAEFGKTGNVSNAPGWVHGHFQTNTGTRDELISDVLPVLKELLAKGIPVELASGARVAAGKDDNYYRGMLKQAAQQHGHSGDGRSIDLFVPEKTKVPVPLTDISGNKGRGGVTGGLPGSGKSWVGHLTPDSKAGGAPGAAPGAAPTPALQSLDVLAPAAEAYAAAVRGVASAMERVRTLQAALTEAQTVAAFEAIAKAAFPQVQLEGYEDNLFTVQATYDAVAASAAGAFDPERAAITIDRTMKIAAANREVKQILDEVEKRPNITEKERNKLADDLAAKQAKYLADLAKEEEAKKRILAVQRVTDFITQTQADTKAIYDNLEVLELRNQLRFKGVDPAVIAGAEALLLNERRMVEATKLLNEQLAIEYAERDRLQKLIATADAKALPALQKKLDDALAEIARLEGNKGTVQATGFAQAGAINAQTAAETEPGAKIRAFIGDAKRELADLEAVAVRISQSIGDAVGNSLANGIMGLIEGTTTAKEVFANFLKSIGQILVQEGTKMIAMYIAIAIAKAIAGMGGGGGGGTMPGAAPQMTPGAVVTPTGFQGQFAGIAANGATFANGIASFAKGGAFTNSVVSSPTMFKFADGGAMRTGLMGEAGPEAIMPRLSAALTVASASKPTGCAKRWIASKAAQRQPSA
jgi:phosphopantetheine adenylyltransferase